MTEVASALRSGLLLDRNPDGGWGYLQGKVSRVEPTALAMLAFSSDKSEVSVAAVRRATALLRRWQRKDGLIVCPGSPMPNLAFNGLAAMALGEASRVGSFPTVEEASAEKKLLHAIARVYGSRLPLRQRLIEWWFPSQKVSRQDNELRAWPWVDGTFSWVEPTAWCLLALKRARLSASDAARRIEEAENLLFDRCCRSGGWNYGNSNMLGQELAAYVPTTAIVLLALGDRQEHPVVARSATFLSANRLRESSGMALALAAIALRRYGIDAADVESTLAEQVVRDRLRGNIATRALALCALTGGSGGHPAFAV